MNQTEKANLFASLHIKGDPIILYNVWDVGSAGAVADAGAKAIATGSWGVAEAQGYGDGEKIPMLEMLAIASRIVSAVDLPVTVDFEGAYGREPAQVGENILHLIQTGAVGLNFEDQIVGTADIHDMAFQACRIAAIRRAAHGIEMPLFINARTDLFLKEKDLEKHDGLVEEAIERGKSYALAGGNCFFVPGLVDAKLIERICAAVPIPVNVLKKPDMASLKELAGLGVGRVSYGPGPYKKAMTTLAEDFRSLA